MRGECHESVFRRDAVPRIVLPFELRTRVIAVHGKLVERRSLSSRIFIFLLCERADGGCAVADYVRRLAAEHAARLSIHEQYPEQVSLQFLFDHHPW